VVTVEFQAAFKSLSAKMRFFRDRCFKMSPLTEEDWAVLGFRQKDSRPPPMGCPGALGYPGGSHAMTIHLGIP
jgi:hypothetical protein